VRNVIGVDNNPRNIESATQAAAANGLPNCRFVNAAVESELPELLRSPEVVHADEVVAIVDPPRGGAMLRISSPKCACAYYIDALLRGEWFAMQGAVVALGALYAYVFQAHTLC
jgi:hypothetical protein